MARLTARERGYTSAWDRARADFMRAHPACVGCSSEGRYTRAEHVHHSVPHRGDMRVFWDRSRWLPLCTEHHNRDAQQVETRGYADRVGIDGLPTDPNHPFNRGDRGEDKSPKRDPSGPPPEASLELVSDLPRVPRWV